MATDNNSVLARRRFLQKLGLLGAVPVVAGYSLIQVSKKSQAATGENIDGENLAVSATHRWGLLIDTSKCSSGCDACVRGCEQEHGIDASKPEATRAQWIRKIDLVDNLTGSESSLPVMCQHCESAPCVDVCPTGASFKRADGVVLVNKHTCIGCRYCVMACPYKARSFIHETLTEQKTHAPRGKGVVEGCTLCVHRIDANQEQPPACAVACSEDAHEAIVFGDLNDPQSAISTLIAEKGGVQVRSDLGLNTGVRYTRI